MVVTRVRRKRAGKRQRISETIDNSVTVISHNDDAEQETHLRAEEQRLQQQQQQHDDDQEQGMTTTTTKHKVCLLM
jgi:hypothetical protein